MLNFYSLEKNEFYISLNDGLVLKNLLKFIDEKLIEFVVNERWHDYE